MRGRDSGGGTRPPRETARTIAHALLVDVIRDGRSLDASRDRHIEADLDPRDKAFVQELVFGTLRFLPRLEAWLAHLAPRPLRRRDADIRILALLGLYQLAFTRVPPYAAISATVELARPLSKSWAVGFMNAALRRFSIERDAIERIEFTATARLAHPAWLLDAFERAWPGMGESIARANLQRPPMTLRVNTRRISRRHYLDVLLQAGIQAQATRHSDVGITLDLPRSVESIPGFNEGQVSIQDEAAQLAATLLGAESAGRVLDACAAPGGKTAHIIERGAEATAVVALDNDPRRIGELESGLTRLGLAPHVQLGDARNPGAWWDGRPFDRILLDAPCSGTGVIRRHPDIKALRRPGDIATTAGSQAAMLRALWPLLARGGRLVYATCSVLPSENDSVVQDFVADQTDVEVVRCEVGWGRAAGPGRQILPGEDAMDGFFYAAFAKR